MLVDLGIALEQVDDGKIGCGLTGAVKISV
jgi:hypothetical protein